MAFAIEGNLWPEALVPYLISDVFNPIQKEIIKAAIAHWNTRTIARWVPKTAAHEDYVVFDIAANSCSSKVGRIGGEQIIGCDVGDGFSTDSIIHEMGHAFGFWHEHTRPDRDEFVRINEDNIEDGKEHNFEIKDGEMLTPYDYDSIMHYRRGGFAIDTDQDTITPLDPTAVIGVSEILSELDIIGVYRRYGAPHLSVAWEHDKSLDGRGILMWSGLTYWGAVTHHPRGIDTFLWAEGRELSVGMDEEQNTILAYAIDHNDQDNNYQIYARCYASVRGGFQPVRVSSDNSASYFSPALAVHPRGWFVVAWTERGDDGQRILARGFNNNGTTRFATIEVMDHSAGTPAQADISMDDEGNFVIVWGSLEEDVLSVWAKGFNADGSVAFSNTQIDTGLGDITVWPRVARRGDGAFAVIYDYRLQEIKIQGFESDGTQRFPEQTVNSDLNGAQYLGDVALLANDDLLIAWTDDRNENRLGQIRAKAMNFDGETTYDDFTVNTRGGGDQRRPRISIDQEGTYIYIVFEDDVDRNGQYQVHVEVYESPGRHYAGPYTINQRWIGQQYRGELG